MKTKKIFKLVLIMITIFTSCEYSPDVSVIDRSNSINKSNFFKENTNKLIQGSWTSNQGGGKYKWVFKDNKLFKSNIYSFGEIDKPSVYKLYFLSDFDGDINEKGRFIFIQFDDEKNGITYEILKITDKNIILSSKFNQTITLEKFI